MCNDCKDYANRVCSRCKRLKSAQDFSKSQRNKLPHETKCKNCIQDIYPSGTLPKDAYSYGNNNNKGGRSSEESTHYIGIKDYDVKMGDLCHPKCIRSSPFVICKINRWRA